MSLSMLRRFLLSWGRRCIAFHGDERGQLIYLTVASVAVIVALAVLPMNTGFLVTQKMDTQTPVDDATVSGAAWIARGMNILSTNNIVLTELFAFTTVLPALKQTWEEGERQANAILKAGPAACGFLGLFGPVLSAACEAYLELVKVAKEYFKVHNDLYGQAIHDMTNPNGGPLWIAMDAVSTASAIVPIVFPGLALHEAYQVAERSGVDGVLLYPPFPLMPVTQGEFSDLCHPTKVGSPSRYPAALQRGYFHLMKALYDKKDRGPLILYRDKANNFVQDLAFGLMLRSSPLNRNTDREFRQFCQELPGGDYTSQRSTPQPFLLKEAQRSTNRSVEAVSPIKHDLNYLGIAWRESAILFMPHWFVNPRARICAYGQARVFNSTSFDLFTPDWRVKLVLADLLEDEGASLALLGSGCGELTDLVSVRLLNTH